MKWINKLHNKYKNKEIWVAGSDATLINYPDNFFDDKIGITLHLAYIKFPKATYRYFNERDRFLFLQEKFPEILDQINIFGFPFYNRSEQLSTEAIGEAWEKGYRLKLRPYPPNGNPGAIFNDSGPNAMRKMVGEAIKGERLEYGGHGTCLHPCCYVAIMMGAAKLNIIGCNFKNIGGKEHFGEAHKIDHDMRPQTPSFTGYRGTRMTRGLEAIIAGCKDHGVKVNWIKDYDKKTKQIVYRDSNPKQNRLSKKVSGFTPL
jgi:hypothetical protein